MRQTRAQAARLRVDRIRCLRQLLRGAGDCIARWRAVNLEQQPVVVRFPSAPFKARAAAEQRSPLWLGSPATSHAVAIVVRGRYCVELYSPRR